MKKIILIGLVILSQTIIAQKYKTNIGITKFEASEESFVPVRAVNKKSLAAINVNSGDFVVQLYITDFKFKVSLMEEHFNENYMDSDKHPKAVFIGKLNNLNFDDLSEKSTTLKLSGKLSIRNIEKDINTNAKIFLKNNKLNIITNFSVQPKDFGIKIPSIVSKKIAENVNINIDYKLNQEKI